MIWESEPVPLAIHVVTIGERFLFVHAQKFRGYLLDKQTGRIITTLAENYKCTRFTLSEPFLIGSNMDLHDLSDLANIKLISTGPPLDVLKCSGAMVSNGRIFYSTNGSGLQTSMACGSEAASFVAPWNRPFQPVD